MYFLGEFLAAGENDECYIQPYATAIQLAEVDTSVNLFSWCVF